MTIDIEYARQIARRSAALAKHLDDHYTGFNYASLSFKDSAAPFSIHVSADSYGKAGLPRFQFNETFSSFESALDAAEAAFALHIEKHDETARRKMALAIIELTDAEGTVTDRALRLAGFAQHQIDAHHQTAAALANEMAGKGPFTVVLEGAGNHVEAA